MHHLKEDKQPVHMRYHFFLRYGWFLQNLEKEAVRTNMHTTVCTSLKKSFIIQTYIAIYIMGLGRCRLLLFFQVAKFTNDSHFSNCPPSLNPVVKQETDKCKYQFVSMQAKKLSRFARISSLISRKKTKLKSPQAAQKNRDLPVLGKTLISLCI